jgi:hypothetical protein
MTLREFKDLQAHANSVKQGFLLEFNTSPNTPILRLKAEAFVSMFEILLKEVGQKTIEENTVQKSIFN